MFHVVQGKVWGNVGVEVDIQRYKKQAEEWGDKVKKNEEVLTNLEKKREQYKGELRVVQ